MMSRDGRKFFYFSTAFFADRKVKILKARYGSDGLILYIYLMCEIFREDGYFLRFDDDFNYILSSELNMNYEKIGQILNFLLERSLFDDTLFKSDKVLTSREIQMTFQEAVKGKAVKNPVAVCDRLWLLKKDETAAFIKVQSENEISGNPTSNSKNPTSNSEKTTTKQSKDAGAAAADDGRIDKAFFDATGKHLSSADHRAIRELTESGVSESLMEDVIQDIGRRGGRIHSFAYFIPAIRDAAQKNENTGLYPETASSEYTETVLDEEYLEMLDATPDEEYIYDD